MSLVSIAIGSAGYSIPKIINAMLSDENSTIKIIVMNLRLPRVILALIVGASLAVAGALLQSVMGNPLADPGSIGVSAGASTAAITILLVFPHLTASVPIFAFFGAGLACILIFVMAYDNGISAIRIILSGVAVNSVLGAYNSFLQMLNSDDLQNVLGFLNGSLSGRSWNQVYIALAYGSIGLFLGFCCIKTANLLLLGEEMARSLGANVTRSRILLSAISAFLAAATVTVVGMVGFVGLIVPHISRLIIGSDYKVLLPVCTLLGGLVLLVADTVGRVLIQGMEIPVGIVMAMVGGPFFLYMLKKKGKVYGG
ncbi:iron ABC transporter permease [Candidatus Epulonipiscium fishelsonii]|uniref:Iron ABC transporter permease n=1 Tax=Candidatus Epulonipiscium fishelsonii TaxID=77094 RepID=A0ACC8XDF1_9FIRM|nr:iron ABC transporter permease [Epulopiscium sp. SCG-B05WGA-EpuloA1]ONI40832.1 iron ABC transporter permease [Epulopiscium sp. SCG-B11WGA-EpuloA1]